MTLEELKKICDRVRYPDHTVVVMERPDGFYVQMHYLEEDIDSSDKEPTVQTTRKWYVSRHATPSEVVQTLLKCALTSAEHRVREHFLVDGVRVFGPHLDIDQLVAFVRDNDPTSRRASPMGLGQWIDDVAKKLSK